MQLEPGKLDWQAILLLGASLSDADMAECDGNPYAALLYGTQDGGDAWAARSEERLLGAFGWTTHGIIWSLWRELSLSEAKAVLRSTPAWVDAMVHASGRRFLYNHVPCDNKAALGWLQASRCFAIDYNPIQVARPRGPMVASYYFRTADRFA